MRCTLLLLLAALLLPTSASLAAPENPCAKKRTSDEEDPASKIARTDTPEEPPSDDEFGELLKAAEENPTPHTLQRAARAARLKGWNELHFAARMGFTEAFKNPDRTQLLAPDDRGLTPLHMAACNGHVNVIRAIVKCGVSPDLTANSGSMPGMAPLHVAAYRNAHTSIDALVALGADPNVEMKNAQEKGYTPIFFAAMCDHLEALSTLVRLGASYDKPIEGGVESGFYPIHVAITHGSLKFVRALLACGVDPNLRQVGQLHARSGLTPLELAFLRDQPEIAELLLDHNGIAAPERSTFISLEMNRVFYEWTKSRLLLFADLNFPYQDLPLRLAVAFDGDIAAALATTHDQQLVSAALKTALLLGKMDTAQQILDALTERGQNANPVIINLLMTRRFLAHPAHLRIIIQMLQPCEEDCGLSDALAKALVYAAQEGWSNSVDLLLNKGASPVLLAGHLRNPNSAQAASHPAHFYTTLRHRLALALLPYQADESSYLSLLPDALRPNLARYILTQNADIDQELISAVTRGDVAVVTQALKRGANANMRNDQGLSALWLATLHDNYEAGDAMVRLLLQHNAEANPTRPDGTTLLAAIQNAPDFQFGQVATRTEQILAALPSQERRLQSTLQQRLHFLNHNQPERSGSALFGLLATLL